MSLTTGGPPNIYGPWGLDGNLDSLLYPINHGILHFVGFDVLRPFVAYAPDRVTREEREEALIAFRSHLLTIESAAPIPYPPLEAYDEGFQMKREHRSSERSTYS